MAYLNRQMLLEAGRDAQDLGRVVNEPANYNGNGLVPTRYGASIKTLRRLLADIVIAPPEGWLEAFADSPLKGAPAPQPQRYDVLATAGQVRIPLAGTLRDNKGDEFDPLIGSLVLYINGEPISELEYSYDGGSAPILLNAPRTLNEDDVIIVLGSPSSPSGRSANDNGTTLDEWHRPGDTHDLQAVYRAYRKGYRDVLAIGGTGLGPDGVFLAAGHPWDVPPDGDNFGVSVVNGGNLRLPDDGGPMAGQPMHGLRLRGEGMGKTVWKQVDNYAFYFNSKTADTSGNIIDIVFEDFTVIGIGGPATQVGHIFAIGGATRPVWRRVEFLSPSSDGIAFQASPNPNLETHTLDPVVEACVFNGVGTEGGRNCISVEDAVNGRIRNCKFMNWCHPSDSVSVAMIDIEPHGKSFLAAANWIIESNYFENSGNGFIALYLARPDFYTTPAAGFIVRNNFGVGAKRSIDLSGGFTPELLSAPNSHGVNVEGNIFHDAGTLRIAGMKGASVTNNQFLVGNNVKIGDFGIGKGNLLTKVERNLFYRYGKTDGFVCLGDDDMIGCTLKDNDFFECGVQADTTSPGYLFVARYGEPGIDITGNRVLNFEGRLKAGYLMLSPDGYGPTSRKGPNLWYGVQSGVVDSFAPPAPPLGKYLEHTLSGSTIAPGGRQVHDLGIAGLTPTTRLRATLNIFVPAPDPTVAGRPIVIPRVEITGTSTVCVVLWNEGGVTFTIPNGTKLIVEEY